MKRRRTMAVSLLMILCLIQVQILPHIVYATNLPGDSDEIISIMDDNAENPADPAIEEDTIPDQDLQAEAEDPGRPGRDSRRHSGRPPGRSRPRRHPGGPPGQ